MCFQSESKTKNKYSGMDPGDVGLTLATLVQILGMMQWGVRQSAETEALLTSVERLMSYTTLDTETTKGRVAEKWPSSGEIEFKHLHFSLWVNLIVTFTVSLFVHFLWNSR